MGATPNTDERDEASSPSVKDSEESENNSEGSESSGCSDEYGGIDAYNATLVGRAPAYSDLDLAIMNEHSRSDSLPSKTCTFSSVAARSDSLPSKTHTLDKVTHGIHQRSRETDEIPVSSVAACSTSLPSKTCVSSSVAVCCAKLPSKTRTLDKVTCEIHQRSQESERNGLSGSLVAPASDLV